MRKISVDIDHLIALEGNEPVLGWKFSIVQFLGGSLSEGDLGSIIPDLQTIAFWRKKYEPFVDREEDLLVFEESLIHIWEPPIAGKRVADGFHRMLAAKLAGLKSIGAVLAERF